MSGNRSNHPPTTSLLIHVILQMRDIANTIGAFSGAGYRGIDLFKVITEAALPVRNDFRDQELSSMV